MNSHEGTASPNMPELPREIYEPVFAHTIEIEEYLKQELTLSYVDLDGAHELQTCYGDILKTINALMDYTRMLDLVCEQWNLTGFDYAAAVEKCRKKQAKKQRSDDVGEDALTLTVRRQQKASEKNTEEMKAGQPKPTAAESSSPYPAEDSLPPWEDDFS